MQSGSQSLTFPMSLSKPCTWTQLEVFRIDISWSLSLLPCGFPQGVSQKQGGWHQVSGENNDSLPITLLEVQKWAEKGEKMNAGLKVCKLWKICVRSS